MDSINCLLHPHHASLMDHHLSLRSKLLGLDEDPYYSIDGRSHRNLVAPKFDVCETATAYLLEGNLPGVADKKSISVEWVANRTLIVRGTIPEHDPEAVWGLKPDEDSSTGKETAAEGAVKDGTDGGRKSSKERERSKGTRHWLSERRTGEFERSFTFSSEVDVGGMKAKLENGLLSIMVQKKADGGKTHNIPVE